MHLYSTFSHSVTHIFWKCIFILHLFLEKIKSWSFVWSISNLRSLPDLPVYAFRETLYYRVLSVAQNRILVSRLQIFQEK